MGGLAFRAPVLSTLFLITTLATLAMPGSANFVGEFFILLGTFRSDEVIAILAFTGVAMASVYMLRFFIRSMHNRRGPAVESRDLSVRDGLVIAPLVAAVLAFGVYPQAALETSEPDARRDGPRRPAGGRGDRRRAGPGDRDARRRRRREHRARPDPRRRARPRLGGALAAGRADDRGLRRAARRAAAGALHPHPARPGAGARDAGGHGGPGRLAVGREHDGRRGHARDRRPDAGADDDLLHRRRRRGAAGVARDRADRGRARRVLRAAAGLGAGHGGAGRGAEPGGAVHRLRAALDPALRAVRHRDAPRALARERPEVPDHRLRRLGDAALRAGVHLRRDRVDRLRERSPRRWGRTTSPATCSS